MLSQTGTLMLVGERPFQRIEVISGIMTGLFREDQSGEMELVSCYIGRPKVFVELIDATGDRQVLYEGHDQATALDQARIWSETVGVSFHVVPVLGAH